VKNRGRKAMFSLLPVEFRQSAIEGRGVFAKKAFSPGEIIVVYAPKHERLAADDPRATEAAATRLTLFTQDGCVLVPDQSAPGGWLCNHSCAPNAALFSSGDGRVQCTRPIARGDEVTIFYGWVTCNGDGSAPCRCGAPACRGAINFDVSDEDAANVRIENGQLVTTNARVRAKLEEYAEFLQSIGQEHVQRTVATTLARLKDQPKGV